MPLCFSPLGPSAAGAVIKMLKCFSRMKHSKEIKKQNKDNNVKRKTVQLIFRRSARIGGTVAVIPPVAIRDNIELDMRMKMAHFI